MTATKERPILFSGAMVRAILDGHKTQTRRVVKPQPIWYPHDGVLAFDDAVNRGIHCPYGEVGDRLWVRETFYVFTGSDPSFEPDHRYHADDPVSDSDLPEYTSWLKKPSIFMPRTASRITLEITDIRVKRVQNISEEDAIAEGIHRAFHESDKMRFFDTTLGYNEPTARLAFSSLWNSINEKRGFGWDTNPWVWAISFKVLPG